MEGVLFCAGEILFLLLRGITPHPNQGGGTQLQGWNPSQRGMPAGSLREQFESRGRGLTPQALGTTKVVRVQGKLSRGRDVLLWQALICCSHTLAHTAPTDTPLLALALHWHDHACTAPETALHSLHAARVMLAALVCSLACTGCVASPV